MRSEQTQPSQELRCQPWRERTIEEGNEETKIDLTYSATNGISRTGPPLGMPILRIIQVQHWTNCCKRIAMIKVWTDAAEAGLLDRYGERGCTFAYLPDT